MDEHKGFTEIQAELKRPMGPFSKPDRCIAALVALREVPRPLAIRGSGPFLGHRHGPIAAAAEKTFEGALSEIDEAQFDQAIELDSWRWHQVRPVGALDLDVGERRNLVRLCTYNHNGYVREIALNKLAENPQSSDWPFVLDRLNDWVPEIKQVAAHVVERLLEAGEVTSVTRWPARVSALVWGWRWTLVGFEPVARALAGSGLLAIHWSVFSRDFHRATIKLLISERALAREIVDLVVHGDDVLAIKFLLEGQILSDREKIDLLQHWSPAARTAALEALTQAGGSDHKDVLLRAVFDPFAHVRRTARWRLQQLGIDPRALYLAKLGEGKADRATIEGFCELAIEQDLIRLRDILATGSVRCRFAAAKALLRLGDEECLQSMLHDSSGRVRRIAVGYVLDHPDTMTGEERLAMLESTTPTVRRTGLLLLMGQGRWVSIQWILRYLDDPDDDMRNLAFEALRRWLWWASHSPTIPTTSVYDSAWSLFQDLGNSVSPQWKDQLESILRWIGERVDR